MECPCTLFFVLECDECPFMCNECVHFVHFYKLFNIINFLTRSSPFQILISLKCCCIRHIFMDGFYFVNYFKSKRARDAVVICTEMPTYSKMSPKSKNEKMLQDEEGNFGLLLFLSSSGMSESLWLRGGFMCTYPKYLCQKDGLACFTIPWKILTVEDRGIGLPSLQKTNIWQVTLKRNQLLILNEVFPRAGAMVSLFSCPGHG